MTSLTTFEVRPATLRDAKAISEIHAAADQAANRGLLSQTSLPPIPADKRQAYWREAIEFSEPQVQVALEDGKIVGFVGFDRSRDQGTPPTTGEIWAIYAATAHWGRGVGLALFAAPLSARAEGSVTTPPGTQAVTPKAAPKYSVKVKNAVSSVSEQLILENPAQYLWVHKRFKTRPAGEPGLY